MAPTVSTSRIKLLPRQRRSAATDTTTSSSGVTSVVISTATARPLVATITNTDEAAGEKTTKRISRQVLHRRLRRLGRKLDDVMTMFKDVADAARIDGKGGRGRQKRGARAGQNARRRLRGKGGRFVAAPREGGVQDSHPDPVITTTTTTHDEEKRQVAVVVGERKKTKKQRRRERGEWPPCSTEADRREREEEQRLIQQLQGQLKQTQEQVKTKELELQARARAAQVQATQASQLKAQLQAQESLVRSAQETVAHHQDEVGWRTVRIAELAEKVETATSALKRERQGRREDAQDVQQLQESALEREIQGRREDAQDVQQLQERNTFQTSLIASLRKEVERWKWSEMVDAYGRHSWMHRETRQTVFVCPF